VAGDSLDFIGSLEDLGSQGVLVQLISIQKERPVNPAHTTIANEKKILYSTLC